MSNNKSTPITRVLLSGKFQPARLILGLPELNRLFPVSHMPAFRGYHLFGNCHACVNLSVQDAFRAVRCIPNTVFVDWLLWLPSPFCAVATNKKEEVFTSLFLFSAQIAAWTAHCNSTKFCDFSRYLCNLRCFDKFPVTPVNRSLFDCLARCAGGVYVISHS